jgi:flagellar basal body-associated protein FliL
MLNSKKGSLWIVIFVFLVLILIGFTLYSFSLSNNKVEKNIVDLQNIDRLVFEKRLNEFYTLDFLEDSLLKSYGEAIALEEDNEVFVRNYFENRVRSNIKSNFENYSFNEKSMTELSEKISKDSFIIIYDEDKIYMNVTGMSSNLSVEGLDVYYNYDLIVETSYEKLGLEGFEKDL